MSTLVSEQGPITSHPWHVSHRGTTARVPVSLKGTSSRCMHPLPSFLPTSVLRASCSVKKCFCQHLLFFAHRRVLGSLIFSPRAPLPEKRKPCCTRRSVICSLSDTRKHQLSTACDVCTAACNGSSVCHAFFFLFFFVMTRKQITVLALIPRTATLPFRDHKVAAMALAEAASGTPSTMSPTLVGLLSRQYSPAGVIELVITVSMTLMFHRWTSVYMPNQ